MAYIWKSETSTLHHNNRFYRNGDNIPAGIMTDDRIAQLVKLGKIVSVAVDQETPENVTVVSDKKQKKGKKSESNEQEKLVSLDDVADANNGDDAEKPEEENELV